ncbi:MULTISPECIES: hypothetical protein [Cyanophyceae]|uniref:hypothetical protein n=1 Tax=Cyanophyceae TaxID=3028117 RepID=UPI0002A66CEF|nr:MULTISPECIES: hypothetical protein [Cyanophyceae]AFZ33480.1 hypothetical protein Glo7428_5093 [Gloeocapsa sp. PCC 7428]PPS41989.1 hypothetical protein B1A85_16100 [Chroococcidiopsis sp. TS-821]
MKLSAEDASDIKDRGWRQGAFLSPELVNKVKISNNIARDSLEHLMILSHDCDVTNPKFEAEPTVELIGAIVDEKDGNKQHGKSPRVYQFEYSGEYYTLNIHQRYFVSRQILCHEDPHFQLNPRECEKIQRWTARRYFRQGFPDEFNRRIQPLFDRGKIRKLMKKHGDLFYGIYIDIGDHVEMEPDEAYEITIWAVMDDASFDDEQKKKQGDDVFQTLLKEIGTLKEHKIFLREGENVLKAAYEVTLSDMDLLKRWDFDDLSFKGDNINHLQHPY